MFNLTHILTYLRASAPTSYDFSRVHSDAVPKDPALKHTMLFLVSVTAMVIFTISECWELRERDRRQQNRPAAPELDMVDIEGRILPGSEPPELDEDDDFMLPPPAYEFHEGMAKG